jgi:hypothetical protein
MIYPVPKPKARVSQPRKGLQRTKSLKRTKMRCGAGSKRRKGHMFPGHVDEARRAFIRSQRCAITGAATGEPIFYESWMPKPWRIMCPWKSYVVCAHVKSRGSGGVDQSNMVPLDARIHDWQGVIGWRALVKKLKLDAPAEIAAEYERRYLLEAA